MKNIVFRFLVIMLTKHKIFKNKKLLIKKNFFFYDKVLSFVHVFTDRDSRVPVLNSQKPERSEHHYICVGTCSFC